MKKLIIFIILSSIFLAYENVYAWAEHYTFDSLQNSPADGGNDGFYSVFNANGSLTLDSSIYYGGSGKSALFTIEPSGNDNMSAGYIDIPSPIGQGGEMWVRWFMYLPSGFSWNTGLEGNIIVKVFRTRPSNTGYFSVLSANSEAYKSITGDYSSTYLNGWYSVAGWDSSFTTQCKDPFFPYMSAVTGCSEWNAPVKTKITTLNGSWHMFEAYYKFHSDEAQGKMRVWIDGNLQVNVTTRTLKSSSDTVSSSDRPFFFHTWNSGVSTQTKIYVDDIVITTDQPTNQDSFGYYMIGDDDFVATPVVSISAPDSQAGE